MVALAYPERSVYNGGKGSDTSTQIATRMLADTTHTHWITVLWAGRNNYSQLAQVITDVTTCVQHLRSDNQHFLVLSVMNSRAEPKGTAEYDEVMKLNAALAATFAGNYLDVRAYLVSLADPTVAQDLVDQANDVVPSSLRSDALHLNTTGYTAAAAKIKAWLETEGW